MEAPKVSSYLQQIFEDKLLEELERIGVFKKYSTSEELIGIAQKITHFPLVLSGSIKVFTEDKEGNELLLYYLETGDTCAMTLQCCMGNSTSNVRAITETDSELIMVPVQQMEDWIVRYPSWRRFVLSSYHERLLEMQEAVDTLAFYDLKERLVKYLQNKALVNSTGMLSLSHVTIANELNTSRVVISRLLKKLENDRLIEIGRNNVKVSEFL